MFASRVNNENAIYEQQTTAAAKPLNQGVKGLAPKTPGNKGPKTPFKVPLNDENATQVGGKTGGKGKQAALFGEGKSGKVESSAFITPAGMDNTRCKDMYGRLIYYRTAHSCSTRQQNNQCQSNRIPNTCATNSREARRTTQ
jgi:hypothetical protein